MTVAVFFGDVCSHTDEIYFRFLEKVKLFVLRTTGRRWCPVAIICDFEKGFMSALDRHQIDMRGCRWHLLEAVKRKLRALKVGREVAKSVLRTVVIMYYSQSEMVFNTSLHLLRELGAPEAFIAYFEHTWIGKDRTMARRWSQSLAMIHSHSSASSLPAVKAEIEQWDTNNFAESMNAEDRRTFADVAKRGKLTLFQQMLALKTSLDTRLVTAFANNRFVLKPPVVSDFALKMREQGALLQ